MISYLKERNGSRKGNLTLCCKLNWAVFIPIRMRTTFYNPPPKVEEEKSYDKDQILQPFETENNQGDPCYSQKDQNGVTYSCRDDGW